MPGYDFGAGAGGAASGAASGAAAGSAGGPVGAGIGALIGGLAGLLGGVGGGGFESPFSDRDMQAWAGQLYQNYLQRMNFARSGELADALMGLGGQAGIEDWDMLSPLIGQIGVNRSQGALSNLLGMGLGAGQAQAQLAGPSPASAIGDMMGSFSEYMWPPEMPEPQGTDPFAQMLQDILAGSDDPIANLEEALGGTDIGNPGGGPMF